MAHGCVDLFLFCKASVFKYVKMRMRFGVKTLGFKHVKKHTPRIW